ncbi:MAG: reverse transcriptase domain-containing protein [Candidatus Electrothrix aestuarii]|uniref:RNA-directed DNA polymerase n=1 Tax=Candidatus Electrothrix aestuarii TaxID=3062594 RepID=A0AAU8LPC4_9BACT|nr:reverse transcriptase domain-containing protein [Candidatus Electrothrix aestuarii]
MTLKASATELSKKFFSLNAPADVADLLEFKNYDFLKYILFVASRRKRYSERVIPKKRGGERKLLIPCRELKLVQHRLLQVLQVIYQPKRSVRGFTFGECIVSNARDHVGKRYVLNVDLKDFFPSIHFGKVRGMFMSYPYSLNDKVATVLAQICSLQTELPQGAPTSPIISNMICAKLDSQLTRLAKKNGCYYTRYADDLTFSTSRKAFPLSLAETDENQRVIAGKKLEKIIGENRFTINPEKIRLQTRYGHQEVTGLTVNKKVNVKRKSVRQVRAMLHDWETNGYEAAESKHRKYNYKSLYDGSYKPSFHKVVKGKIEFIGMVRGKDDSIYIRQNNKAQKLELRDELSPRLFSFIEPPENENEKVVQLIKAGEKDEVEFKESAYLNRHTGKENKELRLKISEELAAFMNTHPEGTLLIGVKDSGEVIGIEREYKTANPQKGNWDGYKLALSDTLNRNMEKGNIHDFYTITRSSVYGRDICCIRTRKVDSPVLVKDKLFHRVGTQCKQIKGENIIKFIQDFNQS